jgi:hypothetical protein
MSKSFEWIVGYSYGLRKAFGSSVWGVTRSEPL